MLLLIITRHPDLPHGNVRLQLYTLQLKIHRPFICINWKQNCKYTKSDVFFQHSWNLFSNSFIRMESMATYFSLFRGLYLANITKCIKLFAIAWFSTAQSPLLMLVSVQTAVLLLLSTGCIPRVRASHLAGNSHHSGTGQRAAAGRTGQDCMWPMAQRLDVPGLSHLLRSLSVSIILWLWSWQKVMDQCPNKDWFSLEMRV